MSELPLNHLLDRDDKGVSLITVSASSAKIGNSVSVQATDELKDQL